MPYNKIRVGTALPVTLVKQIKEYSEVSMIPITRIIETAIKEYLKAKGVK